eukprot:SAG11_NODE_2016_length_3919_cov_4.215445_4_plen_109_part_00
MSEPAEWLSKTLSSLDLVSSVFSPLTSLLRAIFSADIWAYGCIVHEVTVLDYPFKGASLPQVVARIVKGIAEPRAAWRAQLAASFSQPLAEMLDQLMVGTLQPNPAHR